MAATSNIIWEYLGRFLFPEPIILCNSTFLGFLRSRKPNLDLRIQNGRQFENGGHFSKMSTIFLSNYGYFSLYWHQIVQRVGCISFYTVHYNLPKVWGI